MTVSFRGAALLLGPLLFPLTPLHAQTANDHDLGEVRVDGAAAIGREPATEGTGRYGVESTSAGTKLLLSPRETPQSMTVISRQQMDDFALDDVASVMRRTPGVTVYSNDTERVRFSARGFDIENFLYDGMPSMRANSLASQAAHADTYIYDRIEVLRGATGLLNGIGNPSATVNLVRKKPGNTFSGNAALGAGSWDRYRGELDVGGPMPGNDKVRARLVTAYEQGDSFLDHYENEKSVFYGVLEADVSERTLLTLGVDSLDYDPQGSTWGGWPLFYSDGTETDWSRSLNPATDWSSWAQTARTAFINLDHEFANGWQTRLAYTHQENDYDAQLSSAGAGYPDPDTGAGMTLWAGRYQEEQTQDTFDVQAKGPFRLFQRQHELIVGATHSDTDRVYTGQAAENYDTTVPDFPAWNGDRDKPAWGPVNAEEDETARQTGLYATTRFKPTDRLALITGARVVSWKRDLDNVSDWAGAVRETYEENGEVVPYAGVVYDLTQRHSVYASYTSIFQPQTERDLSNQILEPEQGVGYEAGLKSEYLNGRLNTTVALFRMEQDNLAESTGQPIPGGAPNSVAYRAVDGAVTEGVELEITGQPLPRWQVQAGYTHRVSRDQDGEKVNTTAPEDLLRLSTTYQLDGRLRDLTVGAGVSWQSRIFTDMARPTYPDPVRYTQPEYTLVDLMARYRLTPKLSASVTVNNLLDETYYDQIGFYDGGYFGSPREYGMKVRYDF